MFPTVPLSRVPVISKDQMMEVDRIMVDDFGIDLVRMMENAGRGLARVVKLAADGERVHQVVVLAGSGGNGGGALVAARRLAGWGFDVDVYTSRRVDAYRGVPADQLTILTSLGVEIRDVEIPPLTVDGVIIVDGLVGYSLEGAPTGRVGTLIDWANSARSPIVSLDVPSGLDTVTGETPGAVICANATLTLALPKAGLVKASVAPYVGDLYVADIGVPASLHLDAFGIDVEGLFDEGDVVRIA